MQARLSLHTADMVTTMSALAFYGGLAGVQYERIRRLVEEFHRAGLFYLRSALFVCGSVMTAASRKRVPRRLAPDEIP